MTAQLSRVVGAAPHGQGGHFAVRRLDLPALGPLAFPIMGLDHYRMRGPVFAPHPHAGFSAVSYVFEDSCGGLRNRDSLQHDMVISPGSLVWSQAGTGVVHEEFPAEQAREVHGVQIFVNQSQRTKQLPPQLFHLECADVPVVMDTVGNRTRVLSGRFSGATSPIRPAETFDLLDVQVIGGWTFEMPRRRNTLIYALSGRVDVSVDAHTRTLRAFESVAARTPRPATLRIQADTPTQLLVLSGTDPAEPIVRHGPFIMNDAAALEAAFQRYRDGGMGRLPPLGDAPR